MKPRLSQPPNRLFDSPYDHSASSSSGSSSSSPTRRSSELPSHDHRAPIDYAAYEKRRTDSQTPLLPPTPTSLEKGTGGAAYPFPSRYSADGRSLAARIRAAVGHVQSGHIGRMGYKRFAYLVILLSLVGVLLTRHSGGFSTITRTAAPYGSDSEALDAAAGYAGSPHSEQPSSSRFRFPSIPLLPFGRLKSNLPQVPESKSSGSHSASSSAREIDRSSDALPVEATLEKRLKAWEHAPGGRGNVPGEVEHGTFVQWNLEQCSTIAHQHNTHMIQHSALVWATQNRSSLHDQRMELINYMRDVVIKQKMLHNYGEGRGIVMVAGNADTLERVKWSLQMLRSYGSTLPVMIFHFPSEAPAADATIRLELEDLGATLMEAKGQSKDEGKNKSYHLKALAVVQCPWREILYLDSDSIPVRDPEYMFDAPNFQRLGLWATPDYWKTSATNPMWAIMGVKCRNEWEMETGQMFVDKKRHLDVWLLTQYMLERHDWWFYYSDGDKDIFRWAMLALRKRWGVPGRWVGAAALPMGTASGDFCSHTMLQHDSWGEPLFVHYNLLKQIPSGVGRGFSWGKTKQLPLFNTFPAQPSTARLGEPVQKPDDSGLPGLGDVDCDMLADADESGRARTEATEMVMRRAIREQGVKVRYHGGVISALCIDLEYVDPRPMSRQKEEAAIRKEEEAEKDAREAYWAKQRAELELNAVGRGGDEGNKQEENEDISAKLEVLEQQREEEMRKLKEEKAKLPVKPDWGQSPLEVVWWNNDANLDPFENKLYDFGFRPSGPGF